MPNKILFFIIAILTLASAVAAMRLRNPVHCALAAAAAFAGLAVVYLQLDAQFIGFAQLLIYVGAISILIIFAVLLTRGSDVESGVPIASPHWLTGIAIAALVCAAIAVPLFLSTIVARMAPDTAATPVRQIGEELMGRYLLPLETIGLLLTAALIGAAVVAMREDESKQRTRSNIQKSHVSDAPGREVLEEVAS